MPPGDVYKIFINVRLLFYQLHVGIQTFSNVNFRVIIGKPSSSSSSIVIIPLSQAISGNC